MLDDPAGDQLGGKAKLPALAYGSIYKLAAFAVSRSGALPRSMAEHDWRWKPVDAPAPPTDDLPWAEQHLYSRRTAIGRVSIVEVPEAGRVRFEAATPDVTPLAHDYRRRGHGCDAGEDTVFDLWRHTDGTGAIAISPSAAAQTLQLHDVWTWRGGGILALTMLHDPSVPPDPLAAAHWRVRIAKPFVHGHLSLTIGNEPNRLFTLGLGGAGWAIEGSADIPGAGLPVEGAIWLHAQLIPDDGGCALSFADPTPEVGDPHAAPRRSADSFVLLARKDEAPDKRNRWSDALAQSVSAQIRFPCVSHADLDRWLENPVLRQEAGDVRKIDAFRTGNPAIIGDVLSHAVLPGVALGLLTAGVFLRLVRTNVIGTLAMPYVDAARSRGVSEVRLVRTHAYKPALIPIITVIGLQVAMLLGGAVLTETTFEWEGLGFQLAQYLGARDFVAVQGIVALLAVIVALTNFVVDVIAAVIDPRVRY